MLRRKPGAASPAELAAAPAMTAVPMPFMEHATPGRRIF
jgi:hypothetical protein